MTFVHPPPRHQFLWIDFPFEFSIKRRETVFRSGSFHFENVKALCVTVYVCLVPLYFLVYFYFYKYAGCVL
jgi:hypothetical protein